MSANGATKRDLFRVIAERDAEILRLKELLRTPRDNAPQEIPVNEHNIKVVTPSAPKSLSGKPNPRDPEGGRWIVGQREPKPLPLSEEEREKIVRAFAEFLATTASPKGTVQREKLQSFATEFLAAQKVTP